MDLANLDDYHIDLKLIYLKTLREIVLEESHLITRILDLQETPIKYYSSNFKKYQEIFVQLQKNYFDEYDYALEIR